MIIYTQENRQFQEKRDAERCMQGQRACVTKGLCYTAHSSARGPGQAGTHLTQPPLHQDSSDALLAAGMRVNV
jgi:hypothetical protein